MLTAGKVTPLIMQSWTLACKRYKKHGGKTDAEIVSYVAEGMFEPRLVAWYQADQTRIDTLTLDQYLTELAQLVLEKNWAHDILETILSSSQGTQPFMDWKIEVENLNAILTTSAPTKALTKDQLKVQLQSNLHPDLRLNLSLEPVLATELTTWSFEVKERDDRMRAEDARTQKLIDTAAIARSARRGEKKDLLSRLTDAPSTSGRSSSSTDKPKKADKPRLPALTDSERSLLKEHAGCTRCRKLNAGHSFGDCPMKANNTWPDAETYVTLTAPGTTAVVKENKDDDTDSYVPSPVDVPFIVPHLFATLYATGPLITEFPVKIRPLMDIGCPCTVISLELTERLGLRRYPLPSREDNMSSLTQQKIVCEEYVKLELQSDQGIWKSGVHKMKVNKGLSFPIILGMPFLSSEQIVIDAHERTAIDKCSGFDLLNPPPRMSQTLGTQRTIPPPTPKKIRVPKTPTLENSGAPALAGYLLPGPIMAAVRDRIEGLAFQELLKEKDAKMKHKFADRFPLRLPDSTADVPGHMFHRIRLKDPTKVNNGKGYAAPKKYQESWKRLLDDHLKAGRIRPSSSEYASPAFCVPKYIAGVPDLNVDPQWVNDYRALNKNTAR